MIEILGGHLDQFFANAVLLCDTSEIIKTYDGGRYQVWSIPDSAFATMCNIDEESFGAIAGENGWWRHCSGSVLGCVDSRKSVNGHWLKCWSGAGYSTKYESLTSYLCNVIGASTPKNVCACAIDLAKYNKMTLGELFTKYEPICQDE